MMIQPQRLDGALALVREHLLAQMQPEGHWEGRLSSSALSTATAVAALALAGHPEDRGPVSAGLEWLGSSQNSDGGWGDTQDSPSNLATSLLAVAAIRIAASPPSALSGLRRAEAYLSAMVGTEPAQRAAAITAAYGADRTFAVPILVTCALADLVAWQDITPLPVELAAMPQRWYQHLGLQVVSYALPALISLGLALHRHHRGSGTVRPALRRMATSTVLRKLGTLQPRHGGFLEATPLTAFVAMGLVAAGRGDDPVVGKCLQFLRASMRADGSWPIDTNLSVWVTTGAVSALMITEGDLSERLGATRKWIAARQHRQVHPFTGAAPGGWGWTHLAGAVPDADDTASAILALSGSGQQEAMAAGVRWLLGLQNRDGGWPTFCRGWGRLPFDHSCADITAHVLRALKASETAGISDPVTPAMSRGLAYLRASQRADGSWLPLWFGSQMAEDHHNPVLGTSRVLMALALLDDSCEHTRAGLRYLCEAQNPDGGWGGAPGVVSSMEETALSVSALSHWVQDTQAPLAKGTAYLVSRVEEGTWTEATPIGLYFASLWYSEQLYPVIWTLEALGRAQKAQQTLEKANGSTA